MAACALVTCSDGTLSPAKRKAVTKILATLDSLGPRDIRGANDLFDRFTNGIRSWPEQGRAHALSVLGNLAADSEQADRLIRICRMVGRAEGTPSAREQHQIEAISGALRRPGDGGRTQPQAEPDGHRPGPFILTIGNEKGGTGKSTTAMHLAIAFLKLGYTVGSLDLDGRQGTLTRYLSNRQAMAKAAGRDIAMPRHRCIESSRESDPRLARREDETRLDEALAALADRRIVVVDMPGSDTHLARLGHERTDMLITPLNDTLLDIDTLAHIDPNKREVLAPSAYSEMVWQANDRRLAEGRPRIDWIVMRNRLTHIDSHNKRAIGGLLERLAERIGFRLASGFGERVVFHELFLTGLTVLDLPDNRVRGWTNVSLTHARREIRELLQALGVADAKLDQTAV